MLPVATTSMVVKALEMKTFPWTYRFVVPGTAPIPILEVATIVAIFQVPATFTLVVKMLETVTLFVMNALPTT